MKFRPYRMAPDCPVCGEKDEEGAYKGARMGSTDWGHDVSCCSDKCGYAYKSSAASLGHRRDALRMELAHHQQATKNLQQQLQELESENQRKDRP